MGPTTWYQEIIAQLNTLQREALKECLKNLLLVMSVSGIFKAHKKSHIGASETNSAPLEQDIWELSWITINTFCPTLKEDVIVGDGTVTLRSTTSLHQTPVAPSAISSTGP
jgi:hypothetical protein